MRAPVVAPAPVLVSVEAALVVAGGDGVALVVGAGRGRVVGRVGGGMEVSGFTFPPGLRLRLSVSCLWGL